MRSTSSGLPSLKGLARKVGLAKRTLHSWEGCRILFIARHEISFFFEHRMPPSIRAMLCIYNHSPT